MTTTARAIGAALALLGIAAAVSGARAADVSVERRTYGDRSDIAIQRGFTGRLPACDDPHIHGYIKRAFASREREYWRSDLTLSPFVRPVELGYRSWGPDVIPRRFCTARTVTSDGRERAVYWLMAEGLGEFTPGPGVDWCVTGLDRNNAFAPECKMARP